MNEKTHRGAKAQFDPHEPMNWGECVKSREGEYLIEKARKKGKFNNSTKRNEPNLNSSNMIRTQNGVSWQMRSKFEAKHSGVRHKKHHAHTHTQFTQFKLHFTAIRDIVLFHFDSFLPMPQNCRHHFFSSSVLNTRALSSFASSFHSPLFHSVYVYVCDGFLFLFGMLFFVRIAVGILSMNNKEWSDKK